MGRLMGVCAKEGKKDFVLKKIQIWEVVTQQSLVSIWRTGNRIKVKVTDGLGGPWRSLCSEKGRNFCEVPQILHGRAEMGTQHLCSVFAMLHL